MRTWLPLILSLLLGAFQAHAQVEIFINEANKADSVIEFGVRSINSRIDRSFELRNGTDDTIRVVAQRTDLAGEQSAVVREFDGLFGGEVTIRPRESRTLNVRYRAGEPFFPADSLAEARLVLDVFLQPSDNKLFQKVLLLRGLKTGNVLGTLQRRIRFDSVYIKPEEPRAIRYGVRNLLPLRFPIRSQELTLLTPRLGPAEIAVSMYDIDTVEFAANGVIDWAVTYRPLDIGADTAEFALRYFNQDNPRDSVLITQITGFGVQQKLELVSASESTGPVPVRLVSPDTIELQLTEITRTPLELRLRIANRGNANVNIDSITITNVAGGNVFSVVRSSSSILVGRNDTVFVAFAPDRQGEFISRLNIHTDIARRGFGDVPDSVTTTSIFLIGRARTTLRVTPENGTLGPAFVGDDCEQASTLNVVVENVGQSSLSVDSIRWTPIDIPVDVSPQRFELPSGAKRTIQVRYTPTDVGTFTGFLQLYTSGRERVREVPFTAIARAADVLQVQLGDSTRGRPGSIVEMPIIVGSGSTAGVESASLALSFDTTIAEVVGYRQESTASANAVVDIGKRARGWTVSITDDAGLPEGDTLIVLKMRLYLGDSASTRVTILSDSSTIGTRECPDLLPLIVRPGVIALDSVCGLSYKTLVGGLRTFSIGVLPNPAADQATVAIMTQPGATVMVDVLDALGRPCMETISVLCREPLSMIPFTITALPPAAYAVVVRMGDSVQSIPLLVQR